MKSGKAAALRRMVGVHWVAAAFCFLAVGYALATPPWNNPDEPAHFNYVARLAASRELPILEPGDWDAQRLETLKAAKFAGPANIAGIDYEAHQPPLYYALAAPVLAMTSGLPLTQQVVGIRALSILFGIGLVYLTAVTAARVRPGDPATATLASAFVAFVPMHTAMAAAINNDALANLLGAALILLGVIALQGGLGPQLALLAGALIGLAILTKTTLYALIALVLGAMTWAWWGQHGALRRLATLGGSAALVGGWWVLRNALTYGWTDPLGATRHDEVVVGQLRTSELGSGAGAGLLTLRNSFWGDFGWMGIPLQEPLYLAYQAILMLAVFGGVLALVQRTRRDGSARSLAFLGGAVIAVGFALLAYNLKFVQPQGRYLFPALAAIGILVALGITSLLRAEVLSNRARMLATVGVLWVAAALAIEASGGLFPALPRRALYPAAAAVGAGAGLLLGRVEPTRRSAVAVGVLTAAFGWSDLALLLGVVAPAFR